MKEEEEEEREHAPDKPNEIQQDCDTPQDLAEAGG